MNVKVYGYQGCSTCKKAYSFLKKQGINFDEVDITAKAPSKKELQGMLESYDGQLKKLFNTSGLVYREQGIGAKLAEMSDGEALSLLASNGRLVKRPFLIVDGQSKAVGFDEAKWKAILR